MMRRAGSPRLSQSTASANLPSWARHRLLEGVERDQPQPRLQGEIDPAGSALSGEHCRERLDSPLAQPLPLSHQPLLEASAPEGQPLQEIASIQADRLLERLRSAGLHEPFEGGDIHVDRVALQRDGVAGEVEARGIGPGEGAAEGKEGLAKATPRLVLRAFAPEQGLGLPGAEA
jgi:hypothetical protein